ncbi:MAG: potassium channel family protein [Solirubrobacteraceae bacterium]
MSRRTMRYVVPFAVLVVLLAGGGFAALETKTVSSYAEGVWWALSLMTTVGFVDQPTTSAGRVLSAFLIVAGFLLFALVTAAAASLFVREAEAPEERRERDFEQRVLRELAELRAQLRGVGGHPR